MNKPFTLISLCLCIIFLGACAPATLGSSQYKAFDLADGDTVTVMPGSRWFFQDSWPLAYFDNIELDEVPNSAFERGSEGKEYVTHLTSQFSIEASGLPDDWNLGLQSVKGLQKVISQENSGRYSRVRWRESIQFAFYVDVPDTAIPSNETALIAIKSRGRVLESLYVPITVGNGSNDSSSDIRAER